MKRPWIAAGLLAAAGCQDPSPPPRYFYTCGDPVCRGYTPVPGVPRCAGGEQSGAGCPVEGSTCDPVDDCNRRLVCAREDPTMETGGCPISRAVFKRDVLYLDEDGLRRQHAALLALPLATWNYRADAPGAAPRLGFLIEDAGAAACVAASGERVDLYGYTSMAVAALQVQAREIAELKREVAALRSRRADPLHPGPGLRGGPE